MVNSELKEKIIGLWKGKDPTFPGSFAGLSTFQNALSEFEIDVSVKDLRDILAQIPTFLNQLTPPRYFARRKFCIYGSNDLVQMDIAEMKAFNKFKYFLVTVYPFHYKIFTKALRTKSSEKVKDALSDVFLKNGFPKTLESDAAQEFKAQKPWLNKNGVRRRFHKNISNKTENPSSPYPRALC
jgi:hypothetical protein